jgi:hypothetical protein
MTIWILAVALLAVAVPSQAAVAVRVLLGVGDQAETDWSGGIAAQGAALAAVEPWRFDGSDAMLPGNRWKMTSRRIRLFGAAATPPAANAPRLQFAPITPVNRPFSANGIVVLLTGETENSSLEVRTPRGDFSVRLSEIPYGQTKSGLDGKAVAERVPPFERITSDAQEQDQPAAVADSSGNIWLAYLEFKHNPEHDKIRNTPDNFENMTAKPGGDQILLRRYANGSWSDTLAITPPGGDLWRPTIAVDGEGRPWVFWSANDGDNFDIWGRVVENGQPGATVRTRSLPGNRITTLTGADVMLRNGTSYAVLQYDGYDNRWILVSTN